VYDKKTGRIIHAHSVVTFKGGRETSKDEVAARALDLARRRHKAKSPLDVLHVEPDALEGPTRYKVDPKRRTLTPIKSPGSSVKRKR
jgi:hypothetical protein